MVVLSAIGIGLGTMNLMFTSGLSCSDEALHRMKELIDEGKNQTREQMKHGKNESQIFDLETLYELQDFYWNWYKGFCSYLWIIFVQYLISAVLIALAIYALCKENWRFLAPYLIYNLVSLVLSTIFVFIAIIALLFYHVIVAIIFAICTVPFLPLYWYLFFLQFRCGQYFKEKEEYYANSGAPAPSYVPAGQAAPAYKPGGPLPPINTYGR